MVKKEKKEKKADKEQKAKKGAAKPAPKSEKKKSPEQKSAAPAKTNMDAQDEDEFNSFAQSAMDAIKEANQLEKEFNDL